MTDPAHQVVLGSSGFGKTSFTRMLVEPAPRLLVLDHSEDSIWDSVGSTFRSPRRAMRFYLDHAADDFRAVLRFQDPDAYLPFMGAVHELHQEHDLEPVVVVMEEATEWSESWDVPEELERLITRGRKHGVIVVNVVQESTQIHRTIRRNSFVTIIFWHRELPGDLKELLTPEQQHQVKQLEPLDPHTEPERGVHYVVSPARVNPYRRLLEATTATQEELPPDYTPPRLDPTD